MSKPLSRQQRYFSTHPWASNLFAIRQRCNNPNHWAYKYYGGRGIKTLLTMTDIKNLWLRDNADLMKRPTIDRKDNNGNYTFDNCQFLEFKEHFIKSKIHTSNSKAVLQFDKQNNFIREFISTNEAARFFNRPKSHIHDVANNKRKSAFGFIWRYK